MFIYFIVSFLASIVGAVCGVGGGVMMKPVLDLLQMDSVAAINFLSGCTVLAMSSYTLLKSIVGREREIELQVGTPLAIGAVAGGFAGKELFTLLRALFENQELIGAIQSGLLGIITVGTLIYTLRKEKIRQRKLKNKGTYIVSGALLGMMSSFLGIGGGPVNLVVLSFFFDMDTKTAASTSLYIIFFSQLSSLLLAVLTGSVPELSQAVLILMIAGGIGGGIIGRWLHRRMRIQAVDRLFIFLMQVIILICIFNTGKGLQIFS